MLLKSTSGRSAHMERLGGLSMLLVEEEQQTKLHGRNYTTQPCIQQPSQQLHLLGRAGPLWCYGTT